LRYNMVKKAVEKEDKFKVSCYEMKDNSVSYTYKTLAHFNKVDKNVEWYFLTGVDCLMDVEEWNNPSGIFKLCKFIVFNRPGFSKESIENQKIYIENKYSADIIFLDAPLLDISSTSIRENIRIGRNVSYLLPESVYDIIKKYNLYR
jgi:nicotinate-nucleotide adenylyltransferase